MATRTEIREALRERFPDAPAEILERTAKRAHSQGVSPSAAAAMLGEFAQAAHDQREIDLMEVRASIANLRRNPETLDPTSDTSKLYLELLAEEDALLASIPTETAPEPEPGPAFEELREFNEAHAEALAAGGRGALTAQEREEQDRLVDAASSERYSASGAAEAASALDAFGSENSHILADESHPLHAAKVREWNALTLQASGLEAEPGTPETPDNDNDTVEDHDNA